MARMGRVMSSDPLNLNQLADFEAQAIRMALPIELAQHFDAVVEAARNDIMRRLAAETRAEYERQEIAAVVQRDHLTVIAAIVLRDAVVLAGGDDVAGAFDRAEVRRIFVETAMALVESADLVIEGADVITIGHDELLDRIGRALISAAAVKVIDQSRKVMG